MGQGVVAVAYSGGRDSTALLHATLAVAVGQCAEVIALHVHHGLSPHADEWLAHCEAQCKRWARAGRPVSFAAHRVAGQPDPGDSVEAWARAQRYAALQSLAVAHGASIVLLAHHQRDQAETLLLQALRGAGVAGLAGMPACVERDGIVWQRPWLHKPRQEIDAYLRRHRLKHVEDDSNADPRFARNRLRLAVWPALLSAFDQADSTLAAAATWAGQADAVLKEVAEADLAAVASANGLQVAAWLSLSPARRSNALRAWLRQQQGAAAPASLVERLLSELPARRSACWPCGEAELQLYRGVLRRRLRSAPLTAPETELRITGAGAYALPGWAGSLQVRRVKGQGIPLAWLGRLELRPRSGGERFQAGLGRPPRSLKKQYQDRGVPMSERHGPLVYSGGQLVFVPGLGLDARVIGLAGQPLVNLAWTPFAHGG